MIKNVLTKTRVEQIYCHNGKIVLIIKTMENGKTNYLGFRITDAMRDQLQQRAATKMRETGCAETVSSIARSLLEMALDCAPVNGKR